MITLVRSGLLLLNPPYLFDAEMGAVLSVIAPKLQATTRMEWVAGAP